MSEKGMTQQEFADFVGMSRSYLAMILTGRNEASINTLEKLAEALGVEVWELFKRKEEAFTFVAKVGKEYKCTASTGEALEMLDKLGE